MVIRLGASWRAASSRARLNEPRRRLPANSTTRRTSFNACSAMPASSTQERERLGAFHARLEVFAYRQHLPTRQRLHDIRSRHRPVTSQVQPDGSSTWTRPTNVTAGVDAAVDLPAS